MGRVQRAVALASALALGVACQGAKPAPANTAIVLTETPPPASAAAARGVAPTAAGVAAQTAPAGAAQRPAAAGTAARTATTAFGRGATATTGAGGFRRATAPRGARRQTDGCVDAVLNTLTDAQRVGQLFMVGLSSDDPLSAVTDAIQRLFVGGVTLYGTGWNSAAKVQTATAWLQGVAATATPGVALFVSGNQEGGEHGTFQAFYGSGFSEIPSALKQGAMPVGDLQSYAAAWGTELYNAGVNLDLAPVLDTVPAENRAANAPIGLYDREFGFDTDRVSTRGVAFINGMHAANESVAVKHFPGLGRVTGNTDFTATGITDTVTANPDPYLQPFQEGIRAGAEFVMVSLATYTRLDPQNPAVFSHIVVTDLLRNTLGFQGVVISDDMGAAAAVAAVLPAQRALHFFQAGGDVVLTVQPADIPVMTRAVLSMMQTDGADGAFSAQITASVRRVLTAKAAAGLLQGNPGC